MEKVLTLEQARKDYDFLNSYCDKCIGLELETELIIARAKMDYIESIFTKELLIPPMSIFETIKSIKDTLKEIKVIKNTL